MMIKKAVSRLHLLDGTVLKNQVLVIEVNKVISYYSLDAEEAFVAWIGGDYYLS